MPRRLQTVAMAGLAAAAIGCGGHTAHPGAIASVPPPRSATVLASVPTASPARAASATRTAAPPQACGLRTPAERQQWVDAFRASHTPLRQIPEAWSTELLDGFHGDGLPQTIPRMVSEADRIAVVRAVSDELDSGWRLYSGFPSAPHFGVEGRVQLLVEQVLKGDPASLPSDLTLPISILADRHCQPAIMIPCCLGGFWPIFAGEHGIAFLEHASGAPDLIVGLIPIELSGVRPPGSEPGPPLIERVRRLVAAATPTPDH
jgi:hypothetical protein